MRLLFMPSARAMMAVKSALPANSLERAQVTGLSRFRRATAAPVALLATRAPSPRIWRGREHVADQQSRDSGPEQWPDPIDVPVVEEARGHGRTEPACGIHRRTGQRSAQQDVGHDGEADPKT